MYSNWIREELKDRHKVGKVLFGPRYDATGKLITYQDSVESFLTEVDELRTNVQKKGQCRIDFIFGLNSESCRKRGCGRVWSMDGLWKLAYPIW